MMWRRLLNPIWPLEEAKSKAKGYLAELKQGQEWDALATANHMETRDDGFFHAQGYRPPNSAMALT